MAKPKVVVVGGGISGLAAAYKLQRLAANTEAPIEIAVLESGSRPGGLIQTISRDGAIIERGPESFGTTKSAAFDLALELGLQSRLIRSSQASRRSFVGFSDQLHPLPDGFVLFAPTRLESLASSGLFSWSGKLRMSLDLLIPSDNQPADESVAEFVRRRLGSEALERLAEPLVGGIYSGNPEELSAPAVIPRLYQLERESGSLIRGLWGEKRRAAASNSPPQHFMSFDNGLQVLVDGLVNNLEPGTVHCNLTVTRIVPGWERRWHVLCSNGQLFEADAVIIAAPARAAATILSDLGPSTCEQLSAVTYGSISILSLLYPAQAVDLPAGSGFVIPQIEGKLLKACSFSSLKFARRAPRDHVLLRLYADARGNDYSDSRLQSRLIADARQFFSIRQDPLFSLLTRHRESLPQYTIGHGERIARLKAQIDRIPGLALAGNAYNGVSIPDCIISGHDAAKRTLVSLLA